MRPLIALVIAASLQQPTGYRADVEAFRRQRQAEIGGPTGWIALVGLHWLAAGSSTIGRDTSNALVLAAPSAPARLGTLVVTASSATIEIVPGVEARVGGKIVTTAELRPGAPPENGVMVGGTTMVVIRRGGRLALRVWDSQAQARLDFKGLAWLPIDPAWRVDATFVEHRPAPRMKIANVLGETVEMANPGYVSFSAGGREYRLEALLEGAGARELFFLFRDETSGKTTYGAGRYLYTDLPKDGHVVVDFNRAMNPPCAFTDFATCPLPPAANRLAVAVTAGELDHKHGR